MKAETALWRQEDLAYCSNVHPATSYADLLHTIEFQIAGVRRLLGLDHMASGLWISHEVLTEMSVSDPRGARLSEALQVAGVRLVTLNGFPYGNFHDVEVKGKVYQPDWSEPQRLVYTLQLASLLANNLAADTSFGSISTLPLGFGPNWSAAKHQAALENLCLLVDQLGQLEQEAGKQIMVCLEMEPGCVLERTDQLLQLFGQDLIAAIKQHGIPLQLMQRHLGICYDICHQAVMFEDPADSLQRITAEGISIGKIQVSSALTAATPSNVETRKSLRDFVEPRYLHQVEARPPNTTGRMAFGNKNIQRASSLDLQQALADENFPQDSPWHIHFHIPIQAEQLAYSSLGTTQQAIEGVLNWLADCQSTRQGVEQVHPHLEVETYTWQVLPTSLRPLNDQQLQLGLAEELRWLQQQLQKRGLLV